MGLFSSLFGSKPTPPAPSAPPQSRRNGPRADSGYSGNPQTEGPRNLDTGWRHYYDALNDSHDRTNIPIFALYALRYAVKGLSRERLALLGEYLYDNDGLVGYAVDTIANYSVPIHPMACTADPKANQAYEDYFAEWGKRADYTGRHTFDILQRLACKAMDIHGEIAPVMVSENGFPQLQLIETHHITSRRVIEFPDSAIDGVSISKKGEVLGYFVVQAQSDGPKIIPASEMILLYDPERYGNYRGYSPARRGMNDIRDAKDIKGYEKLATKISSALAAVIEGSDYENEDVWAGDNPNPASTDPNADPGDEPPADATNFERNITQAQLLGGDIPVLPEGKKLNQLDNNRPGERVMELLDYLGGCFAFALGLPPAFLIDAKLTGPNQRSVNGKAQRKFNQRQEVMARFVEWVWVRVIAWGIEHDGLPAVDGWQRMEWQGPPQVSIDEGRDSDSWRKDVQGGLMARQEYFSKRSLNWQRETDQGFVEDDYILTKANALAAKQNIPVEIILARWGYAAAKPGSAAPADDTPEDEID